MTDDEAKRFVDAVHKSYVDKKHFLVSIAVPTEEAAQQLTDMSLNMDDQFKFRILDIAHDSVAVPSSVVKELNSILSAVKKLPEVVQGEGQTMRVPLIPGND